MCRFMMTSCLLAISGIIALQSLCADEESVPVRESELTGVQEIVVPLVHMPLRIDGVPDEEFWHKAGTVGNFLSTQGEFVIPQTLLRIARTDDILCLAIICSRVQGYPLVANAGKTDSNEIFLDDSIELLIAPQTGKKIYYHLAVNSTGACYSAKCGDAGRERDKGWEPDGIEVKTSSTDTAWQCELAIPLASLDISNSAEADAINANFCRNAVFDKKKRISSSWTGSSDFNDMFTFGRIVFGATATPSVVFGTLQVETDGAIGNLVFSNPTNTVVELKSTVEILGAKVSESLSAKPFSDTVVPFVLQSKAVSGALKTSFPLTFSCHETGKPEFRRSYWLEMPFPPCGTSWEPSRYYYQAGIKEVDFVFPKIHSSANHVKATLWTSSGSILGAVEYPLETGRTQGFVRLSEALTPGRYLLELSAVYDDNRISNLGRRVIIVMKPDCMEELPRAESVTVADGIFLVNGTPFFAYCSSDATSKNVPAWFPPTFNLAYASGALRSNALSLQHAPLGSKLDRTDGTRYVYPPPDELKERLSAGVKYDTNTLFRRIRYEAQIPAVQSRQDGTSTPLDLKKFYREIVDQIKAIDSLTLNSIHTDKPYLIPTFSLTGADIIEVSFWGSGFAENMITRLSTDLRNAKLLCGDKPLIVWLGGSIPNPECHIAEEMRCALYLSMLYGATGAVIHTGHGGIPVERGRYWSVFAGIAHELETVFPILHSRESSDGILRIVGEAGDTPFSLGNLRCVGRRKGGDAYLIVVNTSPMREPVRLSIDEELVRTNKVQVMFEERIIELKGGELLDVCEGYEAHVYKITKE